MVRHLFVMALGAQLMVALGAPSVMALGAQLMVALGICQWHAVNTKETCTYKDYIKKWQSTQSIKGIESIERHLEGYHISVLTCPFWLAPRYCSPAQLCILIGTLTMNSIAFTHQAGSPCAI